MHNISFVCVNLDYCCSKDTCKTWDDYINDLNKCRTNGAVDRLTATFLSFLSCFGLSNFYMGNPVAGIFEIINSIMALISIFAICVCYDSSKNKHDSNATFTALIVGTGIAILDLAKFMHMAATGSIESIEITVMITSIIIVCIHCTEIDVIASLSQQQSQL